MVDELSKEQRFEPVFLIETQADEAWTVPELLRRVGIVCYRYAGNGLFLPVDPEEAVPTKLYVDRSQLTTAKKCLSMLAEPPQQMQEDELLEAYDEYMESQSDEEDTEDEEQGNAIWKLFLVMGLVLIGALAYLLLNR